MRSSRVARWFAAGALGLVSVLSMSTPAAADAVDPAGKCAGSAMWLTGGFSESTGALDREDVIEIPRKDQVRWSGQVVGPRAGAERSVAGRVNVLLPPPFGGIAIGRWGPTGTEVEKSGTYNYDLPSYVPADVEFDLWASHDEGGQRFCTGAVGLVIEGGPFDSPVIWVALAGLLLFGILLGLLGRRPEGGTGFGRVILGILVGLPFGLFLAATLVLFGVLPLASVLVTVIVALGLVLGAIWAKWAPFGGGGGGGPADETPSAPPAPAA
jgi:hypothetical protein